MKAYIEYPKDPYERDQALYIREDDDPRPEPDDGADYILRRDDPEVGTLEELKAWLAPDFKPEFIESISELILL